MKQERCTMKKILIMMCGIPASGKSTIAYNLAKCLEEQKSIIVSMDNIREEWFGTRKCQDSGDEVYAQSVEDTLWAFENFNIVIYDATNRTKKARKQLVKAIQKYYDCLVYCVYMATPLDIAIERNANRDESIQVPPATIQRMYDSLQHPTEKEKYYKEIYIIEPKVFDSNKDMWYNMFVNQIKGELKQ